MSFVSRAGQKLDHALRSFNLDVAGMVCADFGCSTGGFVDCLLQRGAAKVFAIDTGYGVLDYRLRNDERVIVMERTNAMHVTLPVRVDLVTIDVAWTRQRHILPRAASVLGPLGRVITLIKPHYEAAGGELRGGVLPDPQVQPVLDRVRADIAGCGFAIDGMVESPIRGSGGNREFLALLRVGAG